MTKLITLLIMVSLSSVYANDTLTELQKTRNQVSVKLETAKANGYGHAHPRVKAMEAQLRTLDEKIRDAKAIFEEVVIHLEGTKSKFMQGHPKFGKTDTALPSLMIQGWKINKIIPAGDKGAYIWLIRNE